MYLEKNVIFTNIGVFQIQLKFPLNVWDGCHDVLMMYMGLSNISIISINSPDYWIFIKKISKVEGTNLQQKAILNEKSRKV